MALPRSLIVYNGSDATPASDFTDRTDWQQTELAGMANLGEAAAGQWLLRDEGGTLPDFSGAEELADAHNVMIARVGSNILFRGRIAADEHFRGRQKAGRAKEVTLTLEDQNSHLRGVVVHNWARPAETDVARALALVTDYLSGSPRATTVLGTGLIITGSNTIALPAKTYRGATPYEIMQELAANGDKETFVTVDNELVLFGHDYSGYASLLRISDDPADANATTYAPWEPRGSEFGRQRLSALRVYYGSDTTASVQVSNSLAPQFDYWEDVFWDNESTTAAQAEARAQKQLDYRSSADVSYACAIGPMSGDEIWKIKPGQSIQYKSRASRGGRASNGSYLGDTFLTTRVREVRWTTPAEDQYIAHLELERPKRIGPVGQGSAALVAAGGQPVGAFGPIDTFERDTAPWGGENVPNWGEASSGYAWDTGDGMIGVQVVEDGYGKIQAVGSDSWFASDTNAYPLAVDSDTLWRWYVPSTLSDSGLDGITPSDPNPGGLLSFLNVDIVAPSSLTDLDTLGIEAEYDFDTAYFTRIRTTATGWMFRTWESANPEPSTWDTTETVAISAVTVGFYWEGLDLGAELWIANIDNGTIAYSGHEYGPVLIAIADGATSNWSFPFPYVSGTLMVYVDNILQNATETNPATGAFSLSWQPGAGDEIKAKARLL